MKLYYASGSCALAAHIALCESGLSFSAVKVRLDTHKLEDGTDFHTINPLGYVPVLQLDDGALMREVAAVLQYIADQAPQKNLAPANGTIGRYRLQEWLSFVSGELHKHFGPLFHGGADDVKEAARRKILSRLQYVEQHLEGRAFLLGEHFSVADAYLFVVLRWCPATGVDISGLKNIAVFIECMRARQGVQRALAAEGLKR